jgi:putative addiction module component (TIGR02574 family)
MTPSLQDLGIDRLTPTERLELIAAIWDSLTDTLEAVPVPEWHKSELERRLAAADADPAAGASWEEVKARLRGRP